VDVDLPILDGVEEVLDVVLVRERGSIGLQAAVDFRAFFGREEFSAMRKS